MRHLGKLESALTYEGAEETHASVLGWVGAGSDALRGEPRHQAKATATNTPRTY
jgi:hypothetical protein